jgi:hypothetical protein
VLFSANNIENLGHTLEDFMNIWLQLLVTGLSEEANRSVSVMVVDQLHNGMGHFADDQSPFYYILQVLFKQVLHASHYEGMTVCADKIVTFSSPRDRYPYVFNGLEFDLECSFRGPSAIYQRWNVLVRTAFDTLYSVSPPPPGITRVLLLLRGGNSTRQVHKQANRGFSPETRRALITALKGLDGVILSVQDLGELTLKEQMQLVARQQVIIGKKGIIFHNYTSMCGCFSIYKLYGFVLQVCMEQQCRWHCTCQ